MPTVGTEVPAAGSQAPTASPENLLFSVSPTVTAPVSTINDFFQGVPLEADGASRLLQGGVFGLGGGGGAGIGLAAVVFGLSVAWLVVV